MISSFCFIELVEPQGIEPWSREDHNRIFYMLS